MFRNWKFKNLSASGTIKNSTNKTVSVVLSVVVSFLFVFAFATSTTTISSSGVTVTGGGGSFATLNVSGTTTLSATTTILGNLGIGTTTDAGYIVKTASGNWYLDGTNGKNTTFLSSDDFYLTLNDGVTALSGIEMYENELWLYGRGPAGTTELQINSHNHGSGALQLTANATPDNIGAAIGANFGFNFSLLDQVTDSYTALKVNVTDTVSANVTQKYLMDLQTDSASKFIVKSDGNLAGTILNSSSTAFNMFVGEGSGFSNTTGSNNFFGGYQAGYSNTAGGSNTFLGYQSGYFSTTGDRNVFVGYKVGYENTLGTHNVFMGDSSTGEANTEGRYNTFLGAEAAWSNTLGDYNIAIGAEALGRNDTGSYNLGIGEQSGYQQQFGNENIFIGNQAGYGSGNYSATGTIAIGYQAGYSASTGIASTTFLGYQSGYSNTTGSNNFFGGYQAGYSNTVGTDSTLLGYQAGFYDLGGNSGQNVIIGSQAGLGVEGLSNYGGNVIIGNKAGYSMETTDTNILIGYESGYSLANGSGNVFLGDQSGYYNSTGAGNVFLGRSAGYSELGSNRLYIANSDPVDYTTASSTALIYGEFDNQYLRFNASTTVMGHLGVGTTTDVAYGLKVLNATDYMFFQGANSVGRGYTTIRLNNGTDYEDNFAIETFSSTTPASSLASMSTYVYSDSTNADSYNTGEVYLQAGNYDQSKSANIDLQAFSNSGGVINFSATDGFFFNNAPTTTFTGQLDVQGTATSTMAGNLHVQGTLHAGVSYVGDLIFANNFRFYEDPKPIDGVLQEGTQSLKLTNQKDEDIFSIDENGNLKTPVFYSTSTISSSGSLLVDVFSLLSAQLQNIKLTVWEGVVAAKEFIAEKITGKQICVEDVCFDRSEADILKAVVNERKAGQSSSTATPEPEAPAPEPVLPTPEETASTTPPVEEVIAPIEEAPVEPAIETPPVDATSTPAE